MNILRIEGVKYIVEYIGAEERERAEAYIDYISSILV